MAACEFESHRFRLKTIGLIVQQEDTSSARWQRYRDAGGAPIPASPLKQYTVPSPSGKGSAPTKREPMVRVHPGLLTPRYANGRAVWLKPKRMQVQILLWALTFNVRLRLGRQLADHLGLEPGMLWVRVPPELFNQSVLVEQPGVLATLSRWRSWVRIPSGALELCGCGDLGRHGTQTGKAAKLKPW